MENSWLSTTGRHILTLFALLVLLISFGTTGYMLLEKFSLLDGLYMTIITLTTVGFGEVKPLQPVGRIFTIVLILMGAGLVAYNLAYFSQLVLDGNLLELYRRRRLRKQLDHVSDHFIICGYGQMGKIIAQELSKNHVPVVVVENDPSVLVSIREKEIHYFAGDATEEDSLLSAGILRARGLVSVVSKDTDSVFIIITAKDLNKDLTIYARATTPGAERKLLKAGAAKVVSPYASGALRIVDNILRPTVTDFLDLALSDQGMELSMEEIRLPQGVDLVGKELMYSGIRSQYNLIVVCIKRSSGTMIYNPSPQELLQMDDTLVVIGPQENLLRFSRDLFGDLHAPTRLRTS
ncbi:MAG: potassium channel protein [Syntrophobacteraceae bacterium]|nr:potassium channel protein [Syntrophobacteraceae bacterium]